ncbi:hypothetical protein Pmani_027507, partial [Petrolisthes manimaculis]
RTGVDLAPDSSGGQRDPDPGRRRGSRTGTEAGGQAWG